DCGGIEPHVYRFYRACNLRRQQRSGDGERHSCQAAHHNQNKTPTRGTALQSGALALPTVRILKQLYPFQFKSDIAPISRLSQKWAPNQIVSTILPIWVLASMSSCAAATALSGNVL